MKRHNSFVGTVLAMIVGASAFAFAQLPGPPVGIPQTLQSSAHGYNFAYTFTPNAVDGTGVRVTPTIVPINNTALTQDILRVQGAFTMGPAGQSATSLFGLHVVAPTITNANSVTITTEANLVVEAAGSGGSANFAIWDKGNLRLDGTMLTGAGANTITFPSLTGSFGVGQSCGASLAAAGACPNTNQGTTFHMTFGTFLLSGSTSTVTGITGYTSATSWNCVANDITTRANPVQAIPASGTTVTITNTTGATDLISMICMGN